MNYLKNSTTMKVLFLSAQHSRKGHEDHSQKQYCQNQINQQSVSQVIYLLIQRLKNQATIVTNEPNNTDFKSNLSSTAGNTTDAKATSPKSEAISDSLSSCFSLNLGKSNFTYCFYFTTLFLKILKAELGSDFNETYV